MAGPLRGLKILDFTTLLPGPYATLALADLGADVLRVISGSRPDLNALMPPFLPDTELSANQAYLGRNKRCMTLNLKHPRAREVVLALLAEYDILMEQFRPGVMARLGLDYESLSRERPELIYCSITGYGQTGPLANRAGHDINYLARSGTLSHSGRRESGPCPSGMQIADAAAGSHGAVIGVLAAVIHRQAEGRGQHVDVAMTDGAAALNIMTAAAYLVDGREPGREDWFLNGGSLYDFYETADREYLSFGGLEPKFFEAFCRAAGLPDLIPGGVAPADIERVKARVRDVIKGKTLAEWMEIFEETEACLEPVLSLGQALDQPQARARGWVAEVPGPRGPVRQPAHPLKFSRTPPEYRAVGVPAGAHTREVMLGLGFGEDEIKDLEQEGLFS